MATAENPLAMPVAWKTGTNLKINVSVADTLGEKVSVTTHYSTWKRARKMRTTPAEIGEWRPEQVSISLQNIPSTWFLARRARHRAVIPAACMSADLSAGLFTLQCALMIRGALLATQMAAEQALLTGMSKVRNSLNRVLFLRDIVPLIILRLRCTIEGLTFVASGLAGTTTTRHDPTACLSTRVSTRVIGTLHRGCVLATRKLLRNKLWAEHVPEIVELETDERDSQGKDQHHRNID